VSLIKISSSTPDLDQGNRGANGKTIRPLESYIFTQHFNPLLGNLFFKIFLKIILQNYFSKMIFSKMILATCFCP
jgi:hypothetical protein